jgi:uncharacterized oxidoreductase
LDYAPANAEPCQDEKHEYAGGKVMMSEVEPWAGDCVAIIFIDIKELVKSITLMKITNKKILITGGATGIGLALAKRFSSDNNTVIICGRREKTLQEATDQLPELITFQCDLASAQGREKLYNWISENHGDLNILINNAGIQQWMSITDHDFYSRAKEEIEINIEAPVHLSSLFANLPSLEKIMNVTSGLSFAPLTKVPVYSATKAFMHSFTLSLRHLLKTKNIEVIEIIPPALNTDLGGKGIHDFAPAVSDFIEAIFKQLEEGKEELTHGFSENMLNAGPQELKTAFGNMNR